MITKMTIGCKLRLASGTDQCLLGCKTSKVSKLLSLETQKQRIEVKTLKNGYSIFSWNTEDRNQSSLIVVKQFTIDMTILIMSEQVIPNQCAHCNCVKCLWDEHANDIGDFVHTWKNELENKGKYVSNTECRKFAHHIASTQIKRKSPGKRPQCVIEGIKKMYPRCPLCRKVDCIWMIHKKETLLAMRSHAIATERSGRITTNSTIRKIGYRKWTNLNHGVLGYGNRKEPPECVKDGIREAYPDPNETYLGYRSS